MGRSRTSNLKLKAEYENRGLRGAIRDFNALKSGARDVDRSLSSIGDARGLQTVETGAKDARVEVDRLNSALKRTQAANDRFDDVSRGVGLAGDVQSNLGAAAGLAGAAGANRLSGGIGIAGELVVLTEELPRLKTAVQGLPQTIGAATTALGATGGGLAVAIGLVAAAALVAARNSRKAAEVAAERVDSELEFIELTQKSADELRNLKSEQEALQQSTLTVLQSSEENLRVVLDRFNELNGTDLSFRDLQSELVQLDLNLTVGSQSAKELREALATYEEAATRAEDSTTDLLSINAALEDTSVKAREAARQQQEYNDTLQQFVDNSSRATLNARRTLADPNTTSEDVDDAIARASRELAIVGDELRNNQAISEDYRAELVRQQQELTQTINTLRNERGSVDARTIAAEGFAALEEAAKLQAENDKRTAQARIATIQETAQREQEFARLAETATVEATANRISGLERERAALEQTIAELEPLAATNEEYAQTLARARDELRQVNSDIDRTFSDVLPNAIRRSQEKAAADIAKIQTDSSRKIRDILRDQQRREQEAAQERTTAIRDAQREASSARADALREASQEIIKIERDVQRERQRIQRDFGRQFNRAVSERDALAAFQAKQSRDDELSDLQQSARERRAEVQRQLDEQNRQIAQALREQLRLANERYTREIQTAQAAARSAIATEQEKARAEIATRRQALQAELSVLSQGASQAVGIVTNQVNGINAALSQIGRGLNRSSSRGAARRSSERRTNQIVDRRINNTLRSAGRVRTR